MKRFRAQHTAKNVVQAFVVEPFFEDKLHTKCDLNINKKVNISYYIYKTLCTSLK